MGSNTLQIFIYVDLKIVIRTHHDFLYFEFWVYSKQIRTLGSFPQSARLAGDHKQSAEVVSMECINSRSTSHLT